MPATNASSESSFLALRRIKTYIPENHNESDGITQDKTDNLNLAA